MELYGQAAKLGLCWKGHVKRLVTERIQLPSAGGNTCRGSSGAFTSFESHPMTDD